MKNIKEMIPIFDTDIVYDESVMMLKDKSGVAEAPLLFEPTEILSVTNALKTIEYKEGTDWVLKNGKIVLTENSSIFSFSEDELYPKEAIAGHTFPAQNDNILFYEGSFFIERQIAVTYKCKKGGWQGEKPQSAVQKLPNTFTSFKNRKSFRIVLNGDSISFGANATKVINVSPYMPNFGELLYNQITIHYGKQISYVNTSRGGMDINWAVENVEENINCYDADLVILGFGMNDGAKSPELFEGKVRELIGLVREKNPDCEFILIATSLPNPVLTDKRAPFCGNQRYFLEKLQNIELDTTGVAVANITDAHRYLLTKKRFIDLTSNHVNHPNDFFYRIHAQWLATMLEV